MKHNYLKHLFTALLLLCTTAVAAHDFEVGGIYYNILSETDKTVAVTFKGTSIDEYYNEYTGSVVIPESVTCIGNTYSVTSIGSSAFSDCDGLTSIVIPNSVTSIGESAFYFCYRLTSITIPNSVTSIGSSAFYNCIRLTSITIPNSVTSIEEWAFYYCTGLTSITIPNSVTSIGEEAFGDCTGLTSITIPNSVTSIGEWAFRDCTGLTSIEIPNSVTSIGEKAFSGTAWYNNQPDGVVYAGKVLYKYKGTMPSKTSIVVKEGTLVISDNAFAYYSGLTSIEIPNSVTSIGNSAFSGCTGLTSITIPNSVTSIGSSAFSGCTGLTSIEIPNSVTSIGEEAFSGTAWYNNQPDGVVYAGKVLYKYKGTMPSKTSIVVKEGTLVISDNAFAYYSELTSIEIPNSVTSIEEEAFCNCFGLTSITIPNSVTSIGNGAFNGCSSLTSIEIPNSVTSIGNSAFSGCTGLTSITIPNSVTSIGSSAFSACTGLTSITIPNSVTSIGEEAFWDCIGLTSIEIPNSVTSIGEYAFRNCFGLTSITIPNSVTSIGSSAFSACIRLTSITIPNSVTSIEEDAFSSCFGLTSITIPNSVTSIGNYAFYGCTGLTSITIPNSVTSIGHSAFWDCTGLTSITSLIPADALFTVDSYTFYNVDKNVCTLYVPVGSKSTYASTSGWEEFTNIVEIEPTATEVTVTIGQYGNATYCSPYALDFSEVEGLKAYAATGYKSNSQVVTLTRVQTAEAGIGLFLKGEPGEYIVPIIESTDEHSLNMLVGTLEQTTVNSTDGAMSNYKFTIAEGNDEPMFYPFEDGTTLSAGKAYLQIPTAWLPATAQKSLSVRFDDGETTDIDELKGESGEVKTIYDLQGRAVENPTSGIYIVDGKKVFIK